MGSSDQVGNELDEFVVETLRNNLLGLPLDLPTLNLTRARDAGVPPLNKLRRSIFARTNDGQLRPYTSWVDFGQNLKHPESLINFVAAYGTHPSITTQTTAAGKRAAATLIVNPIDPTDPAIPSDAAEFMFGTGAWAAGANGLPTTGLEDVDLWVGGLAEITNLFGGLLGSTFNYVFQLSLENLQEGDRLYYLARTPGMNLRSQLEGNSFSELITRNTDGVNSLKADAFATADCKFQLGHITFPAAPGSFITGIGSVNDDPLTTDCNENRLLLRKPDGTIQYRQVNSVDPVGINGQSVYNGTMDDPATPTIDESQTVDRIWGGNDNDTFWGGPGNDIIEGNGGDDIALGGEGNDIITDLSGADVEKGGPGNDALDGGIGNDIFMGGDGSDFINGGANDNETFAGPGNDFIIAGQGADVAQGDGGDDWIEGGSGQDLLIGDHSAPFFDDPAQVSPGNDVFIGQVGENDYDTEGGDDLMAQNAAIDRNAGAGGFDWAFHQYNTVPADDDMEINNNLVGVPIQVVVNRDRWQETEADSGGPLNDTIKGTSVAPSAIGGAGFTGCDALDPAGVARIAGLDALVNTFPSPLAPIEAASAPGHCPLTGSGATPANPRGNVWAEGDILTGGGGNDSLEGRGANDIIDGDRSLTVRISVRTNPADPATEIGSTDLMENQYLRDASGALTGPTLQAAVFAGTVDPGNLVIVRELGTTGVQPTDIDTAVFSGALSGYTIIHNANLSTTVIDNAGTDGTDTLWNIELLKFSDQTVSNIVAAAPAAGLSATSLALGSVNTGATTAPQTVTVTNTGTAALLISGVTTTDPQFAATNGCTAAVAPGGTCVISVSFTASASGPQSATLLIASNAVGSPTSATLSGTGLAPVAAVTPATLAFGSVVINTTSAAQTITVNNTGNSALLVASVGVTGANATSFTATPTGCASVAPGASCTIAVTFRTTTTGAKSATVSINHNSNNVLGTVTSVALTGTGVTVSATAPTLAMQTTVNFGPQKINQNRTNTVNVTNSGPGALLIGTVTTSSGAFSATRGNCPASLAVGRSCKLNVTFRPTVVGQTFTGTLVVTSNAANSPTSATLTGSGK
jgi:Ca2+-binding RTX toxin-like protein